MQKPALEKINILRHRAARANEVWKAYQIFYDRQIPVGENLTCNNEENASNITHTLLIVYLSYVYSLFDDSACHFITDTELILSELTPVALDAREHIIKLWKILQNPIQRLRHNTGFHGGKSLKGMVDGYNQLNLRHINVSMVDFLMVFMQAFFRELDTIYSFRESYLLQKGPNYSAELLETALSLEEAILLRNFGHDWNPLRNEQLLDTAPE